MPSPCQLPSPFVIAVAGEAGSGKTTLGRELARCLGVPVLDLDTLTNPLLDALPEQVWESGHWLSSPHAESIRRGRYAALRETARQVLESVPGVILVAPFTEELTGGESWRQLREASGDASVSVIQMVADAELLDARRAARGEVRDAHRPTSSRQVPRIPVIRVDAELSTSQQLSRVLPQVSQRAGLDLRAPVFASEFDAVLFDLDGTLIDSTASVLRSWRRFAEHYGVSMDAVAENHGQPARALISRLLPVEWQAEGLARITQIEVDDAVGLEPVPGAREFFHAIPADRRAIVTSGSLAIASARLGAVAFDTPDVFVTADDITHGKPDPEPYLLAAARLGVDPRRCLVLEDAPAGIASARAAGCAVLAVSGTVPIEELRDADLVVDGLDRVSVGQGADGALRLRPVG